MSSREKNFCGSIADTVVLSNNIAHMRYYAEAKAINSTFEAVMTAIREKKSGEKCEFLNNNNSNNIMSDTRKASDVFEVVSVTNP